MVEDVPPSQKARKRHAAQPKQENGMPQNKPSVARRYRNRILKQHQQENRERRRIAQMAVLKSQSPLRKFYLALLLNGLALLLGATVFLKPQWFFGSSTQESGSSANGPPHHLAVLYPPRMSPREDLPLFFQHYAIATKENQPTRDAMRNLFQIRERFRPFSIFVTAWERERLLEQYPIDDYCGTGFKETYRNAWATGSLRHADDLLYWCLLHTHQTDGFLQWNMTLERSPIDLSKDGDDKDAWKGIVAKHAHRHRIHPSLLWLPQKRERTLKNTTSTYWDTNSQLPARMLPWLLQTAPSYTASEYPTKVEEFMYQLIMAEEERWILLEAVCEDDNVQEPEPYKDRGILGRDCLTGQACCVTYLPKAEANNTRTRKRTKIHEDSSSSDSED